MKIVKKILLKIVILTAVKNRCMLHGRVFVRYEPRCNKTNATFATNQDANQSGRSAIDFN